MGNSERVQNVGCVEARVVAQLSGNDFKGFGEGLENGLLPVRHVPVGERMQVD
jgi:hypothetical protein